MSIIIWLTHSRVADWNMMLCQDIFKVLAKFSAIVALNYLKLKTELFLRCKHGIRRACLAIRVVYVRVG